MRFLFLFAVYFTVTFGYPQNIHSSTSEDQITAATNIKIHTSNPEDERDVYMEALEQQSEASENGEQFEGGQSFYPAFAPFHNPPLGHSRPFYQQEGAYSHRPTAYQQHVGFDSSARFSGYKGNTNAATAAESQGLLGSGNFGVIKGGTFYNDNDGDSSNYDQYNSYYQNGHGRPSSYFGGNPRPQQYQQFENFRDFADINVPNNPAYSQYVVVYANKNGSKDQPEEQRNKPKNIMEHLNLLDLETPISTTTIESVPVKKISKSKRKLSMLLPEKKVKSKKQIVKTTTASTKEYEPLLALS